MIRLLPLLAFLTTLAACDFRGSVDVSVSDSQTFESRGVKFLVPLESSSSQDGDFGFKFDGETVKAETRGDLLFVGGRDYGQLVRGDTVDLTVPGKVLVNGLERSPIDVNQQPVGRE